MARERERTIYPNAVSVKSHNKRFTIFDFDENDAIIEFLIVGNKENVNEPRARHFTLKGIVTGTQIRIPLERVQDIIDALMAYQNRELFLSENLDFLYTNENK